MSALAGSGVGDMALEVPSVAGLRSIELPKLKFVRQNSLQHQQKHVDSLPGKLKVAPSSTTLGALFGTFSTTGNYQVCSCVSEQYRDLVGSKILFSIPFSLFLSSEPRSSFIFIVF